MSGTTWSRFDFAQCFSILPSLKVYKQFHLFVFEEVLFLFFNPRLPCDFHYLEVNYNFDYQETLFLISEDLFHILDLRELSFY